MCGDSQGDVFAFALPTALALAPGAAAAMTPAPLAALDVMQGTAGSSTAAEMFTALLKLVCCSSSFLLHTVQSSCKQHDRHCNLLRPSSSTEFAGDERPAVDAGATSAAASARPPLQLQCVAAFPRIHGRAPVGFCAIHAGVCPATVGHGALSQIFSRCLPPRFHGAGPLVSLHRLPAWHTCSPPNGCASCVSYRGLPPRTCVSAAVTGGIVTSGGRDGCIQRYRLRPQQQWRAAAAEPKALPPPPQQQQQQEQQQRGSGGADALEQQLGAVNRAEESEADANTDAGAGSQAIGALWRMLEAAGRQALVPSSLERLPGISTPVVDVVVPAADAGSSSGSVAAGERIICGWQARAIDPEDADVTQFYPQFYRAKPCFNVVCWGGNSAGRSSIRSKDLLPFTRSFSDRRQIQQVACRRCALNMPPVLYLQAAEFIIASASAGCELRRLACGSLHRPFALHFAPGAEITFVFHRGDQLHIHRQGNSRIMSLLFWLLGLTGSGGY